VFAVNVNRYLTWNRRVMCQLQTQVFKLI